MDPVEPLNNDRRRDAFEALRSVAEEFAARGRLCFAASAKPAMVARVGFDETVAGYPTFRSLLADAEREGWVTLSYVSSGDVRISAPAGEPSAGRSPQATGREAQTPSATRERLLPPGTKIRHDFWNAVIKDSETWLYDSAADAVVTGASAGQREDLVPLPTADATLQSAWVQQFLETLDEPRRSAIDAVIAKVDEPRAKHDVLTSLPAPVRNAWYAWRTRRVLERLEEWKAEHGKDVELLISRRPIRQPPRSTRPIRKGAPTSANAEQRLRDRLHQAIDQMPMSELLRLPIPIEFLIDA